MTENFINSAVGTSHLAKWKVFVEYIEVGHCNLSWQ